MNIKAVLFIIIILLGFLLSTGDGSLEKKRKWYVIIIISLLILESSLRSVSVGPDTRGYFYDFVSVKFQTWKDIFSSFKAIYIEGEGKDAGYLIFVKFIQTISLNFNVFLFACALVFFVPLGIILYRYSTHMWQLVFAFSLYIALFHIVALSGIRQQIAIGFSFMALLQLGKDHNWKAILLIVVGSLVHISALFFLLVPFIKIVCPRWVKTIHLFSFATIPFAIVFAGVILLFFASFLANDYYASYADTGSSGGAYTYIILMELLSLFCFFAFKKENIQNDPKLSLLYITLPLATMAVPLISLNGAMIRIGQYFTLYMMLLVPRAIDSMFKTKNIKNLLYFSMIIILVILGGSYHYMFFWQEPQI